MARAAWDLALQKTYSEVVSNPKVVLYHGPESVEEIKK